MAGDAKGIEIEIDVEIEADGWTGHLPDVEALVVAAATAALAPDHPGALTVLLTDTAAVAKTLAHHLQHLVAHGALHLVGFDHQSDEEAEIMEARERRILAGLGIADPYAVPDDPVAVHPEP